MPATRSACLPPLQWDSQLAEVAQVSLAVHYSHSTTAPSRCGRTSAPWCSTPLSVSPGSSTRRARSGPPPGRTVASCYCDRTGLGRFGHPPGVGQNVAWALTAGVNFTQIIDDLWYRDIARLDPGAVDRWEASGSSPGTRLVTQMLWNSENTAL